MNPDRMEQLNRAALLLAETRRNIEVISEIPGELRPADVAEAYYVSDRLAEGLGWPISGWYCAATNAEIQKLLGISAPYYGRLFESLVYEAPTSLDTSKFPPMMIEVEVVFRLGASLPPRPEPYTENEVAAAVSAVGGSIEVVAGHLHDWMNQDVFSVIADNGTDGALVVGPERTDWQAIDLASVQVIVTRNGVVQRRGSGANVLDGPLTAMTWLANARAAAGDGLCAGHIHNTGTLTKPLAVAAGDELVAQFDFLGDVRLTLN